MIRVVALAAAVVLAPAAAAQEPRSIAELFGAASTQQMLMRMEVSLARVQARRGIIPADAAKEIERTANVAMVTPAAVAEERRKVGHPLVALLNVWAKVAQNGAGEWIHYGATTADIYDTVQLQQARRAAQSIVADLRRAEEAMLKLAEAHRATPMVGRTVGRHALPITFGLKVSVWLAENRRNIERLKDWIARNNTAMVSGAVGSYAALGAEAFAVEAETAKDLGTGAPWPADWKGSKDMFAEYGQILSLVAKTWGKIGQEVFLLQGDDFRELEEASLAVGSSTMPHKVNPAHSRTLVQLSRQIPRQAEVMLDWMVSIHERDQISNADAIGEVSVLSDRLAKTAALMAEAIKPHPANMRRNLVRTNGLIMAEHAMFVLGQKIGKHTAHEEVGVAAKAAWNNGTTLLQELEKRPSVAKFVVELDLAKQLDPAAYLGLAPQSVDRTVAAIRKARAAD